MGLHPRASGSATVPVLCHRFCRIICGEPARDSLNRDCFRRTSVPKSRCPECVPGRCAWHPLLPIRQRLSRSGNKRLLGSRSVALPDVAFPAGCRRSSIKKARALQTSRRPNPWPPELQ
ncbi:unnamed protein product [Ixodes pacificus]